MNRIFPFLACLLLIYSCASDSKKQEKPNVRIIDIDDVKDSLSKLDEIPSDSIHVAKLKETGLYIMQGFGRVDNMIRLVELHSNSFNVLDSIWTFQEDDSFGNKKISYDYKNDWFVSESTGTGSSDVEFTKELVRVQGKRFKILFSYTKYHWIVNPEEFPVTYETVETKELQMTKKQIVLVTSYQMQYEHVMDYDPKILDTVTFEFSQNDNYFIWKKSTNPTMKDKWLRGKGEYVFWL